MRLFYRSARRRSIQITKKPTAATAANPSRTRQVLIGL